MRGGGSTFSVWRGAGEKEGRKMEKVQKVKSLVRMGYPKIDAKEIVFEPEKVKTLYLRCTDVSDISPLSGLTNLEALVLSNTNVVNLSPLSGLTRLKALELGITKISDISPLSGLTNLEMTA